MLEKKAVFGIMLACLLIGTLTLVSNVQQVKSEPTTWTVDDDGPADFNTIQEAIDAASSRDTIYVKAGTYHEYIVINKILTVIGADKSTTFIDGDKATYVVTIVENNVMLKGFTIRNGSNAGAGVYVSGCNYSTISDNAIILNDYDGICLEDSHSNTIKNNTISNNAQAALDLFNSTSNRIINNTIAFNVDGKGIWPWYSNASLIEGNTILNNDVGVEPWESYNNIFYHNNFVDNPYWQVDSDMPSNTWDDGYPSGGNYWNDYNGADNFHGPYQNETGPDGIGDTPYDMTGTRPPFSIGDNSDKYPLMGPFTMFDAGTWDGVAYHVDVVSNSTVSDFIFSADQKEISFSVSGLDGTVGFCRVTVPNDLLGGPYDIFVNGFSPLTLNTMPNGDHTFLYFTYGHGATNLSVTIKGTYAIPEFPSAIILPLLLILTMLAFILAKRKNRRTHFPIT